MSLAYVFVVVKTQRQSATQQNPASVYAYKRRSSFQGLSLASLSHLLSLYLVYIMLRVASCSDNYRVKKKEQKRLKKITMSCLETRLLASGRILIILLLLI